MKLVYPIRPEGPVFPGWVAINWKETFVRGDVLVYWGDHPDKKYKYKNPNEGYDLLAGMYSGSASLNWTNYAAKRLAVYRKLDKPYCPYTSRFSRIPLNAGFSQATPLP